MSDKRSRRTVIAASAIGAVVALTQGIGPAVADMMEPKGLRVSAELVAKPESADELRKLFVSFAANSRKEPGCLHYALLELQGSPGHFVTYEIWTDRAALDAHMKTPQMAAVGPQLATMLAAPFTQKFLDLISQ